MLYLGFQLCIGTFQEDCGVFIFGKSKYCHVTVTSIMYRLVVPSVLHEHLNTSGRQKP